MGAAVGCAALMLIAVAVHAAIGTAGPRNTASGTSVLDGAGSSVTAVGPPATTSQPGTATAGHPASTAGAASGGGTTLGERHVLHVKHVMHLEHIRHLEYLGHEVPAQQG